MDADAETIDLLVLIMEPFTSLRLCRLLLRGATEDVLVPSLICTEQTVDAGERERRRAVISARRQEVLERSAGSITARSVISSRAFSRSAVLALSVKYTV